MYLDTPSQTETNCSSPNVRLHHNAGSQVPAPGIADVLLRSDLEQSGSSRGMGNAAEK